MDRNVLQMIDEAELLTGAKVYHLNERNSAPLMLLGDGRAAKFFYRKKGVLHFIRVLTGRTKAHKQWKAVMKVIALGLRTPRPDSVKVFDGKGKYEACFIYDFLNEAKPMHDALVEQDRQALLGQLAEELTVMYKSGVLFVDFHLGNVLVDGSSNLWWIDVEFKYGRQKLRSLFWSRIERMHHECDPGVLSDFEFEEFKKHLAELIA